jgi:UDP-glucuronate 4-epimerase
MTVALTGAAGFIGMHVARALLARGEAVIGIDSLNDYYDVALKEARIAELANHRNFRFVRLDVADRSAFRHLLSDAPAIDRVVHLAAQAGVRYSLENPAAYLHGNVEGHFSVLEACRLRGGIRHLVYASSSSVYGGNAKLPFSVADKVDRPSSFYAATKAAAELMSHCYAELYRLPQTGLRFFTVYGPWGRPDMSAFIFTKAILAGEPIRVFNFGDMRRDYTYIDDIVRGTLAALDRAPAGGGVPHRLYNLGNSRSEKLLDFIAEIERATGRKAEIRLEPIQPGDVRETYADIEASRNDLGFEPGITIQDGVPRFVAWFCSHYHV